MIGRLTGKKVSIVGGKTSRDKIIEIKEYTREELTQLIKNL